MNVSNSVGDKFSNAFCRTCILSSIKMLGKLWNDRYMVIDSVDMVYFRENKPYCTYKGIDIYLPLSWNEFDVFRNPTLSYNFQYPIISQEDQSIVVTASCRTAILSSYGWGVNDFGVWSDEGYSYSNVASQKAHKDLIDIYDQQLKKYFGSNLGRPEISFLA
jgi:hypothetical protein